MTETILKVDGMACGMCESHINDTVRNKFSVQKVTSSHTKGETVILSEQPLDQQALRDAIAATGYTVTAVAAHPHEIGRAHVRTPVTSSSRMPSSA